MGYEGGGGSFDVSGGLFLVLEILGFFSEEVLKIMKNFEKLWVIISKVGSKSWRWEGYIG